MTAGVEKKPEEVPPSVVDEDEADEGEEDGAPETQGAGGEHRGGCELRCPIEHYKMCFYDSTGEGNKKKKKKKPKKKKAEQTEPPTIGLSKLFPDGKYPEGELQDYKDEYVQR